MHISYNARTIFWSTLFPPVSIEREIQEILISTWFCHFFSQMCVQKVEINLFFFSMGRHIEKKENPQNFFFSNDTHTQKKKKKNLFFFFFVCTFYAWRIYLPGTRIMVTDDMDNTHKVTLLLCKYYLFHFCDFEC